MQPESHRTAVAVAVVTLGVAGVLAAVSVAGSATQSTASVSLRKTALGAILVRSNGHTLYLFEKDRSGKSSCNGSCAQFWPPLLSQSKPTAGPGVNASLLGTTTRANGSVQVTYNKHPLYSFALDKQAGQTKGEGNLAFGAKWYVVSARGTAILAASTASTTTTPPATTTTSNCAYPPCK
jgi:predicted lipoprotein with Yx(FWY)xxD motif